MIDPIVSQPLMVSTPMPAGRRTSVEKNPEDLVQLGPAPKERRSSEAPREEERPAQTRTTMPPPAVLTMDETEPAQLEHQKFLATLPPERQRVHSGGWQGERETPLPAELLEGSNDQFMSTLHKLHFLEAGYTETHQHMVSQLVKDFLPHLDGTQFALIPAEKKALEQASACYEVGKTVLPDEILRKADKLGQEEQELIGRHVLIRTLRFPEGADEEVEKAFRGYSCLRTDGAREAVRHHHERWDGQGYPDGLKGHEIPLTAQILGICDTFDALTTRRPWRWPLNLEQARAAMTDLADRGQFNPELVSLFLDRMAADPETVTKAQEARSKAADELQGHYSWWVYRDAQDAEIALGQGYIDWESVDRMARKVNQPPPDEPELLIDKMLRSPEARSNSVEQGLKYVGFGGVRLRKRA